MADIDVEDLSAYEFAIPCEWAECDEPASVIGRGCGDEHHIAVCAGHHRWIRDYFDTIPPYIVCTVCGSPMLVFEQHFHIVPL